MSGYRKLGHICHSEYTQKTIQIQQTAIWGALNTRNFPMSNGEPLTRAFKSFGVYIFIATYMCTYTIPNYAYFKIMLV